DLPSAEDSRAASPASAAEAPSHPIPPDSEPRPHSNTPRRSAVASIAPVHSAAATPSEEAATHLEAVAIPSEAVAILSAEARTAAVVMAGIAKGLPENNLYNFWSSFSRLDSVIPISMKRMSLQLQPRDLVIAHLDGRFIMVGVEGRFDCQSGARGRCGYQVHNGLTT